MQPIITTITITTTISTTMTTITTTTTLIKPKKRRSLVRISAKEGHMKVSSCESAAITRN
jgi:hypothetical protein